MRSFRSAVIQLINESDLSLRKKRRARFAVYVRPGAMRKAEEAASQAYVDENPNAAIGDGNFEWGDGSLLEFLRGLFEFLLEFIIGLR